MFSLTNSHIIIQFCTSWSNTTSIDYIKHPKKKLRILKTYNLKQSLQGKFDFLKTTIIRMIENYTYANQK